MLFTILTLVLAASQSGARVPPAKAPSMDTPVVCESCEAWNETQAPFKLHGNTYYVGPRGVSSVAIRTSAGVILLDGGLPQSAPKIEASLRQVGLDIRDVKLILNSHAHYDHAGGIARLQHDSGAQAVASASGAQALESGRATPDDPQYGRDGSEGAFPAVKNVRVVRDGEAVKLGDVTVTAHLTPGHTPGSTTWSWRSCEGAVCVNVVYADSLNAVSLDGFRFTGDGKSSDRTPAFKASIAKVGALPCDIVVAVHPEATGLFDTLKAVGSGKGTFIDPKSCNTYAEGALTRLERRIATERSASPRN